MTDDEIDSIMRQAMPRTNPSKSLRRFARDIIAAQADAVTLDAKRWQAFRSRDDYDDLSFVDFQDEFREDADAVIDAAMKAKS